MKTKLLALLTAACLLFCGGCAPLALSVEDLMRPPQLSETQRQVYTALMSALGTSPTNVSLRYPRTGDNRSAFTFADLDGDGTEEVMVFYSLAEAEEDIYVNVMEQDENGWYSVYEIPGAGSGVESVELTSVTAPDGRDILIGWTGEDDVGQLTLLRFEDGELKNLHQSRYTEYITADFNSDGLQELLLVTMAKSGGSPFASYIVTGEQGPESAGNLPFHRNFTDIGSLKVGYVSESLSGLVVDACEGDQFITEIVGIENGRLFLPFEEEDRFYRDTARRQSGILSRDVDGDGIIELPVQEQVPGNKKLYCTVYSHLNDDLALVPVSTAFVNDVQGYVFFLPPEWVGRVTVTQKKSGDVVFSEWNEETRETGRELLYIRVYSEKDYQDKFDTKTYFKLGQRGNFHYYASLGSGSELSISRGELTALFEIS